MKQAIRSVPGIDGSANMMVRLLANPGRWVQSRSAAGVADRIALGERGLYVLAWAGVTQAVNPAGGAHGSAVGGGEACE